MSFASDCSKNPRIVDFRAENLPTENQNDHEKSHNGTSEEPQRPIRHSLHRSNVGSPAWQSGKIAQSKLSTQPEKPECRSTHPTGHRMMNIRF